MNSQEAIKLSLDMGNMVGLSYLEDMTDEELMQRPDPGCNHVIWQLGHLISSERQITEGVAPGSMPALPEGFADRYSKDTARSDDPTAFDSKETLLALHQQVREATLAALEQQTDESLDAASPESMQAYAPTVGAAFNLHGNHWLMHAGQWAVLRRKLGRAPLF